MKTMGFAVGIVIGIAGLSPAAHAAAPATAASAQSAGAAIVPVQHVDAQAVHIALSSLLLAATKMAIEDAWRKTGKAPDSNAAAHVGEPDYLTTNEISSITVHAGGVLQVHFTSAVSPDLTGVWLTPTRSGDAVKWSCVSHSIVPIAQIESYCSYQPAKPSATP